MDLSQIRGLMESYQDVYLDEATAMAKRGLDEPAIRTQIAKSTGGGQAADRATALENKPTYGNNNAAQQRQKLAAKQRGDFRNTTSSNPGLHVGQHKATNPADKAKQAARGAQRGALTPNERKQLNMGDETFDIFDVILEFLYVEGYAETLEEAEWMMANVIDEEAIEIILGEAIGNVINTNTSYGRHRTVVTPTGTRSTLNGRELPERRRDLKARVSSKTGPKESPRMKNDSRYEEVEYVDEGHGSRRSFKTQSKDERWRVNTFGSNYTPHKNYDPEANRGQGQILRPNQAEKQRRKALVKSAMTKEAFNIFVNTLINEGMNLDRYSWDDLHYVFDEIFSESSQANRDPDAYERSQRRSETRGQSAERRVRDRLATMDPDKRAKMIAQMRSVGLNV